MVCVRKKMMLCVCVRQKTKCVCKKILVENVLNVRFNPFFQKD